MCIATYMTLKSNDYLLFINSYKYLFHCVLFVDSFKIKLINKVIHNLLLIYSNFISVHKPQKMGIKSRISL